MRKRCPTFHRPGFLVKGAAKIEQNKHLHFMRIVDYYGLRGAPQYRGRTIIGGFVSIIFIALIIVLNVVNLVQLIQGQRTITASSSISLNPRDGVGFKVYGIFTQRGVQMDFPEMDIIVPNQILFYEADKPSLQKILVLDNTLYNPSYSTNFTDPPVTKSIYTTVSVPFNSVELNIPGSTPTININVNQLLLAQLPSKFSQSIQTLDLIQEDKAISTVLWYPHNISAYIRFDKTQLRQLLSYQLDVAMYNVGERKTTKSKQYSTLTTLTTDQTLHEIDSVDPNFNVLVLRNFLGNRTSSDTDAVNWNIGIQYSPNFDYILGDNFCYDAPTYYINQSSYGIITWIKSPAFGATTFEVLGPHPIWPPGPFKINIQNTVYDYWVTIESVSGNTLQLVSPLYADFESAGKNCSAYNADIFVDLIPPPSSLPPTVFSQHRGRYLDARSWYLDTVCECHETVPSLYCMLCEDAQLSTFGNPTAFGYLCDVNGRVYKNATTNPLPLLTAVTMLCTQGAPILLGSGIFSGLFDERASAHTNTYPCPEDEYYGKIALVDFNTPGFPTWCNLKPNVELIYASVIFSYVSYVKLVDQFTGILTLGAFNYTVDVVENGNTGSFPIVDITGLPDSEPCGTSQQSIGDYLFGNLFAPPQPGDNMLLFLAPFPSAYLPTVGPYTILLETYSLITQDFVDWRVTISSAFCPDDNLVQTLIMQDVPSPALLNAINTDFKSTTVAAFALEGDFVISITNNPIMMVEMCKYLQGVNYNFPEISFSSDLLRTFRTSVNFIADSNGNACCGVSSCSRVTGPIYIELLNPLPATLLSGSIVYLRSQDGFLPVIALLIPLVGEPRSEENKLIYRTQDRYRSYPVLPLDVEVAAFIVPEKRPFAELTKLCGIKSGVPTNGAWKVTRPSSVQGCSFLPTSEANLCKNQNSLCTDKTMSPTNFFMFEQNIPVNNKWEIPDSKTLSESNVESPEYLIDTSTIYYFDYTNDDLITGHQFSSNNKGNGDFDQNLNKILFSGEMDFIGRSASTDSKYSLYPANAPILDFTVQLNANPSATRDLINKYGEAMAGVWKAIGWQLDTVDRFKNLTLSWPTILPLALQPGFNYTFKATVSLQPIYDVGIAGGSDLLEWQSSIQTSFEKAQSSSANQANVRLQVTFVRDVNAIQNRVIYSFFDFAAGVGSSIGLFAVGLIILGRWQRLTLSSALLKTEIRENNSNPYTDPNHATFSPLSSPTLSPSRISSPDTSPKPSVENLHARESENDLESGNDDL